MVIFILYIALFIAVNTALIVSWSYNKSRSVNCRVVNLEKCLEFLKNFVFVLFPAIMIQMLAYYEIFEKTEAAVLILIFVCVALIYLADTAWQAYKYRNMTALRNAYYCDMDNIEKLSGIVIRKNYLLVPKVCASEIIFQINELPWQKAIKDRRLVGYILSIVMAILLLLVGVFFEDIMLAFVE